MDKGLDGLISFFIDNDDLMLYYRSKQEEET